MDRTASIHFVISMTTRVLGRAHLWATRNTERVPRDITEFIESPRGLGPGAVGVLLLRPVRPDLRRNGTTRATIPAIKVSLTPEHEDALPALVDWCREARETTGPRWSGALLQGGRRMRFVSRHAAEGGRTEFSPVGDTPADWISSALGQRSAPGGVRGGIDGLHTETSWEIFADRSERRFALVVRSGEDGPTLAVLLLRIGRLVKAGRLDAAVRRRKALENLAAASWEIARVISQKFWLLWSVAAEKTLADLHRLAPIQQDEEACRHHEIFPKISKIVANIVGEVASMVQSPAVAVFAPDTNGRLGILAGVGYAPDLPRSCDDRYVGITWLFSNVATIASRFHGSSAAHAFQVIGDRRLLSIYRRLHLPIQPREQRIRGNDHHLHPRIAASAWKGTWSWCGFELEAGLFCAEPLSPDATDEVSQYKRDAARNVRAAADRGAGGARTYDFVPLEKGRASGVLKVQSRRRSTLDLDLDRDGPSFSHRELRYLQHAAGLIGLVIQRLSRVHLRALSMSVRAKVSAALALRGVTGGVEELAKQLDATAVMLVSSGPPVKVITASPTRNDVTATTLARDLAELSVAEDRKGTDADLVRSLRERPVRVGTEEHNAYRHRIPGGDAYLVVIGVPAEMPPLAAPMPGSRPNLGFSRFLQHVLDVVGSLFCVALPGTRSKGPAKTPAPRGASRGRRPVPVPEQFQRLVEAIKLMWAGGETPTKKRLAEALGCSEMSITRWAKLTGEFGRVPELIAALAPPRG